jgi:DNA-binding CsgD family transcriptional regulator
MQTRAPVVVGRDRELAVLHRRVADARAGNGGTVFLVGEPGIGKSRLAATATGAAFDRGLRALRGRGSVIGPMVPYRPLTEALLSLSRSGDLPDLGRLAEYRPVLGRLIPEWGSTASPDLAPSSVVVLAEAVLRLLALVGEQRGCLLVLEDLQDADAETLGVLEYLVDNVPGQPVLLVATIRAEPCDAVELARSAGERRAAEVLELTGLGRSEVAELAAACLDVPTEGVPAGAAERLWVDSAGNPFVVEELLHGMVAAGLLVSDGEHWRVVGDLRTEVPAAVVRSIAGRTDRLGEPARTLLSLAAVLGRRFSLTVLRRTTGADDRTILANLHAGVAAQLVTPDEPAPDWYAFRHPLTAEALLAALSPGQRGELSDRAADAVEHLYPGLPGDWCQLVASLRLASGDQDRAGELFAEAGRRAMEDGAAASAVALLDRAHGLLSAAPDLGLRATTLERLLLALGETGRFDRAFELVGALDELGEQGLAAPRWAGLHARLASVARLAGRVDDGTAHVAAARALLGPHAGDEHTAPVDCIDAYLALSQPGPDRLQAAASLATRAVEAAERVPLPLVACDALQLLGVIAREHDLAESDTYFDRSGAIAERHHLPIKRLYALVLRAGTACLLDGGVDELERAGAEASRLGAVTLVHEVDGSLALQAVLRGEYVRAAGMIDDGLRSTTRLRFDRLTRYLLMVRATLAAHRGDRPGMEAALADFHGRGGESYDLSLAYGLAGAFCGLLEEDRAVADRELAQVLAYEERSPTTFHLAGRNGLHLLLGVLDGRSGWEQQHAVTATAAGGMRWNSHFVWLATAVLHGRDGSVADAERAMQRAAAAGALFPMAAHLGLRLVADAAHDAGWGRPAEWLLAAERHFHDAGVPAVASACRASLRRIGASVPQRRSGVDRLPLSLRSLGMTVREFEVFQLLADRLGNKAIGARLHISPRTVEKHVASLMAKTRQPDRESLSVYARTALA